MSVELVIGSVVVALLAFGGAMVYEFRAELVAGARRLARAVRACWVLVTELAAAFWDRWFTVSWSEVRPFVMSRIADREPAAQALEPVPAEPETPDTAAVEPAPEPPAEKPVSGRSVVITPHLDDATLIAILARQQTSDGQPRFSGNQIAAFVGGNRAERLAQIKAARGEPVAQFRREDGTVGPATRPVTNAPA